MHDRLRPLRQPAFALLWSATVLSNLGFWVQDITMGWLLSDLTTSPALIALLPFSAQLPIFLLSLPAGALADRTDLRKFLLLIQSLLVMLVFGFAALIAFEGVTVARILMFACAGGTLMAIAAPARQAVLPSMVIPQDIRAAVMLSSMGYNASRAVGPMIGGVILSLFGPLAAMLSYAGSCLMVGTALFKWRPNPAVVKEPSSFTADIKDGFRHVIHRSDLRNPLLGSFMYFLFVSPIWAFIPLIAKGYAQGSSTIFSLFLMAVGLGSVIGGFSKTLVRENFSFTFKAGALITALGMTIIALCDSIYIAIPSFFIVGIGWIGVGGGINAHILSHASPAFRARAISFVMIIFAGGLSFGSLFWGVAATFITVTGALLAGSVLLVALASVIHLRPYPLSPKLDTPV